MQYIGRALVQIVQLGSDAEQEIDLAAAEARKRRVSARVALRYELPEGAGMRTVVEVTGW